MLYDKEMIEEDYEAWDAYPQYRWLFNKLELALKLGYEAGPACVPVKKTGEYIVRPVYNLYGMGISAVRRYLSINDAEDIINHKHISPGHFWCEWFEGKHQSVDFIKEGNKWVPFHAMVGKHESAGNLTKFIEWEVTKPDIELPDWLHNVTTEMLNIETIGDKIIEVHLRSGNDVGWNYDIGTKIIPAWKGDKAKDMKFLPNLHSDIKRYEAHGQLSNVRIGYYVA